MPVNATAVVNIDVNQKSFQDFLAAFDKYQKVLAKTPAAWANMSKEQKALAGAFNQGVAALMAQNEVMRKMSGHTKDVSHHFKEGHKHVEGMGKKIKEIGHGILGITEKLMKWGAIVAGLVTGTGIAGFFGLDRLGDMVRKGSVSGTRVGMSMGSLKALEGQFGENYGMDVKGVAQKSAQAADDPASDAAIVYKRLGLDPTKLKGTQRVTALMQAIQQKMAQSGLSPERFADIYRLGDVGMGAGDARMIQERGGDLEKDIKHAEHSAPQLDMKKKEIEEWKKFMTELEHATERLQVIIARYLTPILKVFTEQSDQWLTDLDEFLKSESMTKFINELPGQLKKVWEFMKGLVANLEWVGVKLGWIKQTKEQERMSDVLGGRVHIDDMTADEKAAFNKQRSQRFGAFGDFLNENSSWEDIWKNLKGGYRKTVNKDPAYDVVGHARTIEQLSNDTGATDTFVNLGKAMWKGWSEAMGYVGSSMIKPNLKLHGAGDTPQLQTGTDLGGVSSDGTYKLHRGEIVLPRNQAEILRGSGMNEWKKAISGVESGGNYGIMNTRGSGATGKYQVMPFNIGPWTKQALGYSMTQEQFRNSPAAQEKVFETIFGQYVQKFGNPIDAASAWFSGQPLTGNKAGPDAMGTTVPGYIQKFLTAMTGQGGGGHLNLNVNDNTGGNVALNLSNVVSTGPLPLFPV